MSETRTAYVVKEPNKDTYCDVRYPDGTLAFRIDIERELVEIQRRGQKHYFDLRVYFVQAMDKHE